MILSDKGIALAIENGVLEIDPLPIAEDFSTSALDIYLGAASTFRRWKSDLIKAKGIQVHLNLAEQQYMETARHYAEQVPAEQDGSIVLPPYSVLPQVMLCQTLQRIFLKPESRLAARVEGKSSLARLGLMVHMTAPTIHAGFNATIALEMVNHGPFFLKLVPFKTRICQFIFEQLDSPPSGQIKTRFQGQVNPT